MGWRIGLIQLVGVVLVGTATPGTAPQVLAQQTIALQAPKWDVGDHWAWQLGGDQVTWTVLSAGGEYRVAQKSPEETGTFLVSADFSSIKRPSWLLLPLFYRLQFPLTFGNRWSYTTQGTLAGYGVVEFENTHITEGLVSITVPAGTFDSVRIYGRSRNLTPAWNYSGTFIVWYAPKVKQVVRITWSGITGYQGGPAFTIGLWAQYSGKDLLLASYKLHNP